MASPENLAYVAEHDPARALQEYRRRQAATPQQMVHAPVTLVKQEKQYNSAPSVEASYLLRVFCYYVHAEVQLDLVSVQDDQKAMANLQARAAKARKMNAYDSTQVSCLHGLLMSHAILLILMGASRHMALVCSQRGTLVTSHLA